MAACARQIGGELVIGRLKGHPAALFVPGLGSVAIGAFLQGVMVTGITELSLLFMELMVE
jgi:hypothetical protein